MASLRLLDQFKNVRCSSTPSKRLRLKLGFKTSTSVGISRCKVRKLTDEFTRIKSASILGKGGFSTVKLVYRKEGNKREYYAVKVLDKPDNEPDETYVARALAEFDIGRNLCHTNIIKTLDLCRKGDKLCFVMEYCKHGDLCGLMDRRYLTYGDAKCLFKQLLRGIAYMHSRGIAHHDIKPENLLLADDGTLKIIDFGLSVVFADLLPANDRGERKLSKCRLCGPRLCGTTSFLPPEVLRLKGMYPLYYSFS
jgi:serine/threonine protein kinase